MERLGRITYGPDGNLWLTCSGKDGGELIIKMTPSGIVTEFKVPTTGLLWGITSGLDGNIWFTQAQGTPGVVATQARETNAGRVIRLTYSGKFTAHTITAAATAPSGITTGPDGNLWLTDSGANSVDRMTTSGALTQYRIPTPNSDPAEITPGPDGSLWLTESAAAKVARVSTSGTITEFTLPDPLFRPWGITSGRDGSLWVTEASRLGGGGPGRIANVSVGGTITQYPIPALAGSIPWEQPPPGLITSGPDGNIWFSVGDNLDRITTGGVITQYVIPPSAGLLSGLTVAGNGSIWFLANDQLHQRAEVGKLALKL